jgi:predicted RNA-binding protein with PIN domain
MTKKKIDITPHQQTMRALSFSGYTTAEALSELIDNSLDAREENEKIIVEIEMTPNHIIIRDNGIGMTETQITNAMRLGWSEKTNKKLGEFGLGMKTSLLTLGNKFTIVTTPKDSTKTYMIKWDQAKWEEEYKKSSKTNWEIDLEEFPSKQNEYGTEIKIEELKFSFYPNLPGNLREKFGLRFAPQINASDKIIINGGECTPPEIRLLKGTTKEFDFSINEKRVWGYIGVLQKRSPGKFEFGFNTFRRGRLITQWDRIGFSAHASNANLYGELHMDDFEVTHNKRQWIKNEEYEKMKKNLVETIHEVIVVAQNITNKDIHVMAKEGIKMGAARISGEELKDILDEFKVGNSKKEIKQEKKKQVPRKDFEFIFGKHKMSIIWTEEELGKDKPLWESQLKDGELKVTQNADFPVKARMDVEFVQKLICAEALAKELIKSDKNLKEEDLFKLRDKILIETFS